MLNAPVQARLTPADLKALDDYRREQPNPPSRARAARELIRLALGLADLSHARATTPGDTIPVCPRREFSL